MSRRITTAGVGLSIVALVTASAAGALAAGAYRSASAPDILSPLETVTSVAVAQAAFDDTRAVTLAVDRDQPADVVSPISGKVTGLACRPGVPLGSGESILAVDGAATVGLATSVPLWRDLAVGDNGADVTALQQELLRLGQPVSVTGTVNRSTTAAFSALLTEAQGSRVTASTVAAGRVVWLPHATTQVDTCDVSVGASVAAGDVLATVPGALRSVSLTEVPASLVAGPRTLVVDGTAVPIDPDAPLTDLGALAKLSALPGMQPPTAEQTDPPSGRLKLTDPVQVSVVPPSAIVFDAEDAFVGCVLGDGDEMRVQVVGSQLGQTYVLFDETIPTSVEIEPTADLTCT